MKRLQALAAFAAAAALPQLVQAQDKNSKYRVIMHVCNPDPRGWNQALSNVMAMSRNLEGNVSIRLIAIGAGLGMLIGTSPAAERVAMALKRGATLLACGETMKALSLEKEDMLPGIGFVPGGLIEILDRQREGWQYLKVD